MATTAAPSLHTALADPSSAQQLNPRQSSASRAAAAAIAEPIQATLVASAATAKQAQLVAVQATPQEEAKPATRRGKRRDESAEQAAAEEAEPHKQARAGKKRVRDEESGHEGVATAAGKTSPQSGRALLAEAAAMPLPQTEQKTAMKTMIPDSQVYCLCQCLLGLYKSACYALFHTVRVVNMSCCTVRLTCMAVADHGAEACIGQSCMAFLVLGLMYTLGSACAYKPCIMCSKHPL